MSTHLYNEAQIVALVTEYYHLLDSLCYLSVDEIEFPPSEGRSVDESLCHELNLTAAVVSLMRRLPCPCAEGIMLEHELFLPRSHANSFVDNNLIKLGRDPELGENLWFLAPAHIALSVMGDEGRYLVLDTAKSRKPPSPYHTTLTHRRANERGQMRCAFASGNLRPLHKTTKTKVHDTTLTRPLHQTITRASPSTTQLNSCNRLSKRCATWNGYRGGCTM